MPTGGGYLLATSVTNKAKPPRKTKPKGRHPDDCPAWKTRGRQRVVPLRAERNPKLDSAPGHPGSAPRARAWQLGLGSVALVSLAEAREKALANRKLAREGGDPLAEKRRRQGVPSFAEATARVVEQKQAGWRNRAHGREWILTFERYAFPRIGKMPVSEVTSADVLEILAPIWHTKADTARRLRQRIRAVLEWAVAMEFRIDNPCDRIDPVLGPQHNVVQHMRALPHREVAAAIQTARASTVPLAVRLAFEFLVLTAARWGEVRDAAEWTEIARDEGVWTVPARRKKAIRREPGPAVCLCPGDSGRGTNAGEGKRVRICTSQSVLQAEPRGEATAPDVIRKHLIAAVLNGFRSSFRDWAAEETNHPREVIEAALAHVVQNRVEAAYRRTDLFDRRRRLMNDWGSVLGRWNSVAIDCLGIVDDRCCSSSALEERACS